jgi:polysaccharide deacetylase 2 family uncharacterized protein YibQ
VAEGAFWLALACALVLGVDSLAASMPGLSELLFPPRTAESHFAPAMPPPPPSELPEKLARLAPDERPAIAIVIDDLGGDVTHTSRAIALPRAVALAFLPYPSDTPALARQAARAGHEILVHMPMQAMGDADPGPMALAIGMTPVEIARRLDWAFARVPGFVGINNHEGSRFTADADALAPVMRALAARHLFFLDSRTTAETQVVAVARSYGVATGSRDVFLDNVATVEAVDAQLRVLEAKARAQGAAIAIGHPHEFTLDAIASWAAHHEGVALVTLREAMRRKARASLALLRR